MCIRDRNSASDWFLQLGPGDICLLVGWRVKPVNAWSTALGETHPSCGELSASPGPDTTALPWYTVSAQLDGTRVQFWG
eukprot:10406895-Alexandrium_andersonii.AAC.1